MFPTPIFSRLEAPFLSTVHIARSSFTSPLFSELFHSPPSLAQTINMETTGSAGEIQWEAQYHSLVQGRQKNTQLVALV